MEEKLEKWLDAMPYPAVTLPEKGKRFYRNRLARRLLPPSGKLREILSAHTFENEDFLQEIRLDSIAYLLVVLPMADGVRVLCFFEHFLPLQEALSRALVRNMKEFFWALLDKENEPCAGQVVYLDRIAARVCAMRAQGDNYLRLLDASELSRGETAKTCSIDGFFAHMKRALDICGIQTELSFPRGATVLSEGSVLSFLVLNLVHFVRLFEGERRIRLSVSEEGEYLRFSVSFPDGGAVAASFENLICNREGDEKLLHTLPLLCILRVCLENGIPWSVGQDGDMLSVSFLLAKGEEKPVLFLSDATAEEIAQLLQMIKNFFS